MNKVSKVLVCLLVSAIFVMPISAMQNEVKSNIDNPQQPEFVAGEFIVKFTENVGISSLTVNQLNDKYHVLSMDNVFKNAEGTTLEHIYKFSVSDNADILTIVEAYAALPYVVYAEPNYIGYFCITPNDEYFDNQWALHNTGQTGGTPDVDMDAPEVWEKQKGSSDIVIAVLDTGIDFTHPDLINNIWYNEDEIEDNGIDDDNNGFIDDWRGWDFWYDDNDPTDGVGHGTAMAGIIGANTNNSIGIAGICWNCKIMNIQMGSNDGHISISKAAEAVQYATDNGADIISMSFGFGYEPSEVFTDAADYAYEKRVVLVAAAGNAGVRYKFYPAAYDTVIAVAGTDHNDNRMEYYYETANQTVISNYGLWVDVAAPGENILVTMPTYEVYFNSYYGMNQNYDYGSGTSNSCPYVAGLAALILSKNSTLSPDEVRKIIRKNVDPYQSIYYLGTGRVNAYDAVTKFKALNDDESDGTSHDLPWDVNLFTNTSFLDFLDNHPILFPILRFLLEL